MLHVVARGGVAALAPPATRLSRTVRIARGAPISLRATVGDITVTGWDRPDVEIEILRTAPSDEAMATISSAIDSDATGLRVTTVQPGQQKDAQLRGSITIHAPADQPIASVDLFEGTVTLQQLRGGVRAAVEHGSIAATTLGGAVRLETTIGDVRLDRTQLSAEGTIHLRAFNGNVTLAFVAPPVNARILALSLGGAVHSDIPLHMRDQFGPRFGEATLGTGTPVVSLDVVSGDIRISGATK
jgi:hypothetical protein